MKSPHRENTATARLGQALIAAIAALAPALVLAVCSCGFGDGQLTLVSINVNGNMNDWAPVHADVDNNVCDGPANGLVDRDAPVQSTGRDLSHFAYTYDANNVYLFTERSGSTSNTQSFVYYADVDNDGLMETGEPAIGVTWQGSNRRINVYVYTYVAQAPAGDPMVDGNGFGDGYTLPGSFTNVPSTGNPNRSGNWGSSDGLQMEFFVTWAELGLAPNSPFTFHVASSNASLGANSFTAQVDDNLSGCGGRLGSTTQPGLTFAPDLSLSGITGQSVTGVHTLTNDGNATDSFDISTSTSGDFTPTVTFYEDTDGSGTLTAGDTLLTDADGDSLPNTPAMAPGETITVLVVHDVPADAVAGQTAAVTATASSEYQPLANDSITDTISALAGPTLVVTKSALTLSDPINLTVNPKAIPGGIVEYTVTIENQGVGTVDTDSLVILDPVPTSACLVVSDIGGPGSGPVAFVEGTPGSNLAYSFVSLASTVDDVAFSNDNGSSYSYVPTPDSSGCDVSVTHLKISPTGEFAANSGSGPPAASFRFRMLIN